MEHAEELIKKWNESVPLYFMKARREWIYSIGSFVRSFVLNFGKMELSGKLHARVALPERRTRCY